MEFKDPELYRKTSSLSKKFLAPIAAFGIAIGVGKCAATPENDEIANPLQIDITNKEITPREPTIVQITHEPIAIQTPATPSVIVKPPKKTTPAPTYKQNLDTCFPVFQNVIDQVRTSGAIVIQLPEQGLECLKDKNQAHADKLSSDYTDYRVALDDVLSENMRQNGSKDVMQNIISQLKKALPHIKIESPGNTNQSLYINAKNDTTYWIQHFIKFTPENIDNLSQLNKVHTITIHKKRSETSYITTERKLFHTDDEMIAFLVDFLKQRT